MTERSENAQFDLGQLSRRSFITLFTVGSCYVLDRLAYPPIPPAKDVSLYQHLAPPVYSVDLPEGVEPLTKSQRYSAQTHLRSMRSLMSQFLQETVYNQEDDRSLEQIETLDDGAFTLWFRNNQIQNFTADTDTEYWNFYTGPSQSYRVQIEYGQPTVFSMPGRRIHIRTSPNPFDKSKPLKPVDSADLNQLLKSTIKIPPQYQLDIQRNDQVLAGIIYDQNTVFRTYATTEGTSGVIMEGPVLAAPIIKDPLDIPELIPTGLPGGITKG